MIAIVNPSILRIHSTSPQLCIREPYVPDHHKFEDTPYPLADEPPDNGFRSLWADWMGNSRRWQVAAAEATFYFFLHRGRAPQVRLRL